MGRLIETDIRQNQQELLTPNMVSGAQRMNGMQKSNRLKSGGGQSAPVATCHCFADCTRNKRSVRREIR